MPKKSEQGLKKICAVTMARNDEFFLTRWIDYYGRQLGEENLYIYLDGEDQPIPQNSGKANIVHCKRIPERIARADKSRVRHLSREAARLLETYDLVIGTDADEFLVVDPRIGKSLARYLSEIKIKPAVSGLGLDVGQKMGQEDVLDPDRPFLSQRSYALLSTRYTKSAVISRPVRWGSGFHRVKGQNFRIDKNLFLFHFGCVDYKMIEQRFSDNDRMEQGWERHLKKRTRTIAQVSRRKALNADKWMPVARILQACFRPPYAINKPGMLNLKLVVKIPERFQTIV